MHERTRTDDEADVRCRCALNGFVEHVRVERLAEPHDVRSSQRTTPITARERLERRRIDVASGLAAVRAPRAANSKQRAMKLDRWRAHRIARGRVQPVDILGDDAESRL